MSKYTTEVRFICETEAGLTESTGFNDVLDVITTAAPNIFNFTWPIFDETYRLPLEIKILRHFYTREICEETVGLWKLRLNDRLNMIMPYYNQLYASELIQFNPLYDVDLLKEHEGQSHGSHSAEKDSRQGTVETKNTETSSNYENKEDVHGVTVANEDSNSSSENTHWNLYSDTPQGGINGITNDLDSVSNNTYLTNARKETDENTSNNSSVSTGNSQDKTTGEGSQAQSSEEVFASNATGSDKEKRTVTNLDEYTEHITGKQGSGSYSKMLLEFRKTFLNIDQMILDELNDLFFGLW